MTTLSSGERSALENAVLRAREIAETGVRKRFDGLGVTDTRVAEGLGAEDRALRVALRRRAAALGRGRTPERESAPIDEAVTLGLPFLIEEIAYETWHRSYFARVLAENGLMLHPEYGVPLSIDDVRGLADEAGRDLWDLAAEFAANRLPGLFRMQHPLRLATEDRLALDAVLAGMDADLFTASDAIGWSYQFWQAKRKEEVNRAGKKITGATLPPVTQLFTEDYIVDFLLQNSLGAWYIARHPESPLRYDWPYLRFRDDGTPAAGAFPTWPARVADVTVLDPCCGSGHFLVAALPMLVAMRMEEEGLSTAEATDAVLRDNLFGLELDARCTQIATFAVALEAWKRGGHPEQHLPHIACSGIPVSGQEATWLKLAGGDENLKNALRELYKLFANAAELGSLIDPKAVTRVSVQGRQQWQSLAMPLAHEWDQIERKLRRALERETAADPAAAIFTEDDVVGAVRAAEILSGNYTLVATNVPFLSRKNHDKPLRDFADNVYPEAKKNLATLMIRRGLEWVEGGGSLAVVSTYDWYFLGAYKKLRNNLLVTVGFNLVSNLGFKSFRTPMWDFNIGMTILTNTPPAPDQTFAGIDASNAPGPDAKADLLRAGGLTIVEQSAQLKNPDQRISLEAGEAHSLLQNVADGFAGLQSGDFPRYGRYHWELAAIDDPWSLLQTTVDNKMDFGGRNVVLYFSKKNYDSRPQGPGYRIQGLGAWNRKGVLISQMRVLPATLYTGEIFDNNCAVIMPKKGYEHLLPAIWAFCSSPEFNIAVRKIDSKLNVTNATLVKVPFDLERWRKVAEEQYPNGLPEPYSSDPTQWLFKGSIAESDSPLQVAMARLLGYRWPEQIDDGLDALADADGIVCLPSIREERPAHDRLERLLQAAYGDNWNDAIRQSLFARAGASSFETWLRDYRKGFFAQHVKLFQNRPFLWLISDGRKDGFAAVVNYHKLDANALNTLIHTYLGEWIQRQTREETQKIDGATGRREAAEKLRAKLIAILEGEPPYDLYVRWKSLTEQPIGWNPDLNDGVRLNIRPFIAAGVLAAKVNVKWEKDRGNDPALRSEPLAAGADRDLKERIERHCATERWNDLHFTTAEKRRARELAE